MSKTYQKVIEDAKFQAYAIGLAMSLELENYNQYAIKALAWDLSPETRQALVTFWYKCNSMTRRAALSLDFYAPLKLKKTLKQKIFEALHSLGIKTPLELVLAVTHTIAYSITIIVLWALVVMVS